jgi:multiple sugar transport system permease protein
MKRVAQTGRGAAALPLVRRLRRRRARAPLFAWLMVLPAVAVLLAVTIYPLIYSLRASFYRIELTFSTQWAWVGFDNYVRALTDDPRFWPAMYRSVQLVFFGVLIELVLGLGLALLLNRIARGRSVVTALLLIPVMMAPVVVATQGVVIFNVQFGPLNYLLSKLGIEGPIWLGDRAIALKTILLADVWQWTPFVAVIMLAGLQSLPSDLYEAAEVDGANAWQQFRSFTLPLLQPLIIVTVLLRAMDIFKVFDYVYVLTGGGPGDSTEVISFYTYLQGLQFFSFGYAAALSYLQLILVSVFAAVLVRRMRRGLAT